MGFSGEGPACACVTGPMASCPPTAHRGDSEQQPFYSLSLAGGWGRPSWGSLRHGTSREKQPETSAADRAGLEGCGRLPHASGAWGPAGGRGEGSVGHLLSPQLCSAGPGCHTPAYSRGPCVKPSPTAPRDAGPRGRAASRETHDNPRGQDQEPRRRRKHWRG